MDISFSNVSDQFIWFVTHRQDRYSLVIPEPLMSTDVLLFVPPAAFLHANGNAAAKPGAGIPGLRLTNPTGANTARTTRYALLNISHRRGLYTGRQHGRPVSYTMRMFMMTALPIPRVGDRMPQDGCARAFSPPLAPPADERRVYTRRVLARAVGDDTGASSAGRGIAQDGKPVQCRHFSVAAP